MKYFIIYLFILSSTFAYTDCNIPEVQSKFGRNYFVGLVKSPIWGWALGLEKSDLRDNNVKHEWLTSSYDHYFEKDYFNPFDESQDSNLTNVIFLKIAGGDCPFLDYQKKKYILTAIDNKDVDAFWKESGSCSIQIVDSSKNACTCQVTTPFYTSNTPKFECEKDD